MEVVIQPARVEDVVASGLLHELDIALLARYPGEPVNGIEAEAFRLAGGFFLIARAGNTLVGCGAFRPYDDATVEIKRMYVRPAFRGNGIADAILRALEVEARRRGFSQSILETAQRMPEAIALYLRCGYVVTAPFGQYVGSERSVCMQRDL